MLSTLPLAFTLSRFHAATLVDADDPARADVEAFIARTYAEHYGAELRAFPPCLLAFRDAAGGLQAAVGLRRGTRGPLFAEQYLDEPVDVALRMRLGMPVRREELVEVGSFASRSPGDAREVIVHLTDLLHRAGVRWVVFVATQQLRNAFDRLRLATEVLGEARMERLLDRDANWGSYYDARPRVLFGDIAAGHAFLHRQRVVDRTPRAAGTCAAVAP